MGERQIMGDAGDIYNVACEKIIFLAFGKLFYEGTFVIGCGFRCHMGSDIGGVSWNSWDGIYCKVKLNECGIGWLN